MMNKYIKLRNRIKNIFVGFYIDEELDEYPHIDIDKTN